MLEAMGPDPAIEILIVEDEESIRTGLCDVAAFHGWTPASAATGEEGLREALTGRHAVVILDVMLPGIDGFTICRKLREKLPRQAILMLTAKGAEEDVLEGFRCGADDYVTKPFSVSQLVARVQALLRRSGRLPAAEQRPFAFGPWRVDPASLKATRGEETIDLSRRETAMLALLARERGRIVSRRTLLQEVWGWGNADGVRTRTVDVHFAALRRKVDDRSHELIETVRGEGYRFVDPEAGAS